jgi:hypothetical protein
VCSASLVHVPAVQFILTVVSILNMDALLLSSNVTLLMSFFFGGILHDVRESTNKVEQC